MERSLPVGWTVHTCTQEGALLKEGGPASVPNAHPQVCDLFHEDAQVGSHLKFVLFSFYFKNRDLLFIYFLLHA